MSDLISSSIIGNGATVTNFMDTSPDQMSEASFLQAIRR